MSKQLRIIGVSLLISAALLKECSIPFAKWVVQSYEFNAFIAAIKNISPTSPVLEMTAVFPAILILLCLGAGLLLAYVVDALFEKTLRSVLHKTYTLAVNTLQKAMAFKI